MDCGKHNPDANIVFYQTTYRTDANQEYGQKDCVSRREVASTKEYSRLLQPRMMTL